MDEITKVYEDRALQRELEEIYSQYHNSIKIFIGQLEVLQNKFPVEILNEIRAVFSHIAKAYVCESEEIAWENVNKAKGHIKRAQLDAYKYMCYAFGKYYIEFRELYKNVDLSHVNNGDFINELSKTYASAIVKAENARMVEAKANDVIESYEKYEDAYNEYATVYRLIITNLPITEKLQQKEKLEKEEFDKKIAVLEKGNEDLLKQFSDLQDENNKEKKKNTILTYVSIGLGILSVVLGIVAFI